MSQNISSNTNLIWEDVCVYEWILVLPLIYNGHRPQTACSNYRRPLAFGRECCFSFVSEIRKVGLLVFLVLSFWDSPSGTIFPLHLKTRNHVMKLPVKELRQSRCRCSTSGSGLDAHLWWPRCVPLSSCPGHLSQSCCLNWTHRGAPVLRCAMEWSVGYRKRCVSVFKTSSLSSHHLNSSHFSGEGQIPSQKMPGNTNTEYVWLAKACRIDFMFIN